MSLFPFFEWLDSTSAAAVVRETRLVFPSLLTAHVIGIILLAGSIAIVDLRLLGRGMRRQPVSDITQQLLPWTWAGFVLVFLSGFLLLASEAMKSYGSTVFRLKMALLALAGLNALAFHFGVYRHVARWDSAPVTPIRARLAGAASLALWFALIAAGQAMPYE